MGPCYLALSIDDVTGCDSNRRSVSRECPTAITFKTKCLLKEHKQPNINLISGYHVRVTVHIWRYTQQMPTGVKYIYQH
jgi:hypothetical protein